MQDDEPKLKNRRSNPGRRTTDMIMEVRDTLRDHLKECYDVRVEQNQKLESIQKHLEKQDDDLEGIRTLKKVGQWGMGLLIAMEAVFNVLRALGGH